MTSVFLSVLAAVLFVFVGNLIGKFSPLLRNFSLPGAVIGGLLVLLVGPQVFESGIWPIVDTEQVEQFYSSLKEFPGFFITIVFACLMLGRKFEPFGVIWGRAKSQVVMGHLFAWGQYVVGILITVLVLSPLLGVNELAGPLVAIGFQGGHGTAAGLGDSFSDLGFDAGEDFALAVATVGVLAGVVGGPFLANVIKRKHENIDYDPEAGKNEEGDGSDIPQRFEPNPLTGRLTVHLAMIGIVIALGWSVLQGLQSSERWVRGENVENYFSDYLPLFSVVLIAGMAVQAGLQAMGWDVLFDRGLFEKISSFALDMVIVGALGTLSLKVLGSNWLAISLLSMTGLAWNLLLFFKVGPHVYRKPWYAYGLGDLGGGTATTASGIMLINVVDPDKKTDALKSYADKQPFYEPVMGGGLVTALALPIVSMLGPWIALIIVSSILAAWGYLAFRIAKNG